MSTLSLRIPESIHQKIKLLSKKEHISINQFISSALSEKLTAMMTEEYISKRAARAKRSNFQKLLNKVSDQPPDGHDVL